VFLTGLGGKFGQLGATPLGSPASKRYDLITITTSPTLRPF